MLDQCTQETDPLSSYPVYCQQPLAVELSVPISTLNISMSTISTLDASSGAPSNEQFHGMSDLAPISTTHVISQSAVGSNNVPVQEDDQSVHNRGDCVVGNQEGSKNADADDEENDVLHGSSRSIV